MRLQGEAVNELTRLFLIDYGLNDKKADDNFADYYGYKQCKQGGYCIPFGDGPKPVYERQVAKAVIMNMLNQAKRYVYITTPYLIIPVLKRTKKDISAFTITSKPKKLLTICITSFLSPLRKSKQAKSAWKNTIST